MAHGTALPPDKYGGLPVSATDPFIGRMQAMGVTPKVDGETHNDWLRAVEKVYQYLRTGVVPE